MKRFLYLALCLILVLTMAVCIVSCGKDDETEGSSATTKPVSSSSNDTTGSSKPDVPAHEHTFETMYSYDDEYHFFKATCEHTDEVNGKEAHSHNIFTGVCVCGHTQDIDIEKVIDAIIENKGSVTSGTIADAQQNVEFNVETTNTYEYKFYEDYLYIKEVNDYTNEYYYAVDQYGNVFGAMIQGSFVNRDEDAFEDNMNGPELKFTFLGDYDTLVYGAESYVQYFYNMGKENSSFFSTYVEGAYAFGYATKMADDSENLYVIAVSFTVNEETGTLAQGAVMVYRYGSSSYTEVDGVYVVNENAEPNYLTVIAVEQSCEALEPVENPYDPDKVLVQDFTVEDAQGNDIEGTVISVDAGQSIKLYFKGIAPETALLSLSSMSISIVDSKTGANASYFPYYNSLDNSYLFTLSTPGNYNMTITVDEIEVSATIDVALKTPTKIESQVYDSSLGAFNKVNKVEVYVGSPLYFMSYVEKDYNGEYTVEFVGDVTGATLTAGEIGGTAVTVFKADAAGTYTIKLTSTVKTSLSTTLTVTVVEAPSLDSILTGAYVGKDAHGEVVVNVTFDSDAKTVTVESNEMTAVLTYTTEDGFAYELSSGDEIVTNFYISENYELVIEILYEEYVLEPAEKEIVATGTIEVVDVINSGKNSGTYSFELDSNGNFTFYKDGVVTTDVTLVNNGDGYSMKHPGLGMAQTLIRVEGTDGELAGTYKIEMNLGSTMHMSDVIITVDAEQEPVKESTTGTIEVIDEAGNGNKNVTYTYEIVDGLFVLYLNGEVTTEAKLAGSDGIYTFSYPGSTSTQTLIKTSGDEGVLAGTYKIEMNLGGPYLIATVTITPDPVKEDEEPADGELTTGTLTIVDNNNGAVSGTYTYEIVNGAFVFYKDGIETTDIIVTINLDGTYSFQAINCLTPQVIVKVDGEAGVLAGTYNVNGVMEGLYVLTFTPGEIEEPQEPETTEKGSLTVEDNNNGAVSGTYTYEIVNGAFVFYKDGVETTDIIVTINLDGTYSFQAINCVTPQVLVKVEGETGVLAGTYNVNGVMDGLYVLTFTPEGAESGSGEVETPVVEEPEFVVGNNAIDVPAGGWGVDVPFTSEEGGKFTLDVADGETNAYIVAVLADGAEIITLPYEFTLAAGETITFNVCPYNYEEDTIDLVIAKVVEEAPAGPVVYTANHASGRVFQVTIDASAGTMSVTRSDLTGNLTTGGAITCEFTYAFDGTTVTYELTGGSGCGAITFDENGAPSQLVWGAATVTGFAVTE